MARLATEGGMTHLQLPDRPAPVTAVPNDGTSRLIALEDAMAAPLDARYAIAVTSPMAAFHLAYRALRQPVGTSILTTSLADPTVVRAAVAQGAVVLTDDVGLAARCRRLRDERPEHRLSELHAALALVELGRIAAIVATRARIAAHYDAALTAHPLATRVAPAAGTRSAWTSYLVRVPAW